MDLRRQLAIVRTWSPLVAVCVIVLAGASYLVSARLPKVYEAKATLVVGQSLSAVSPDYNQLLVSQQLSTTYARVATTRPILQAAIKQLGLGETPDTLGARVRADSASDSTLLTITAQDGDPARASAIANAVASQLVDASPAIQGRQTDLQKAIDADLAKTRDQILRNQTEADALTTQTTRTAAEEARLQTIEAQLITLRSTYATLLSFSSTNAATLLSVIEPSVPPTAPVSPKVLLNVLLGAFLGLLIATTIAFVAEYLNDSVKDADTVQKVTGLSTLGSLARVKGRRSEPGPSRLSALRFPRSPAAEAYRTLRTNTEFASPDAPIRTLLVTSAVGQEGKTDVAANLAVVFAMAGKRVLLIDADLRKPDIHAVFDLPNEHGLTTLLRSTDIAIEAIAHASEQGNLSILTTGPLPPNPADLLGSQRMRGMVQRLQADFDLLIFDSAPLENLTDSAVLASYLDGTLLVVDARRTGQRSLRQAHEALSRVGANVLGVVLNRVGTHLPGEDDRHDFSARYVREPDADEPLPDPLLRAGALAAGVAAAAPAMIAAENAVEPPASMPRKRATRRTTKRPVGGDDLAGQVAP